MSQNRLVAFCVVCCLMLVTYGSRHVKAQNGASYTIVDLGTLGGSFSLGATMNVSGDVTGDSAMPQDATYHAFLYSNGVMTDIGTFGGLYSYGTAINNNRQVTGAAYILNDAFTNYYHAFLYSNGAMTDLSTSTLGQPYGSGVAINASGQVTGWADAYQGVQHAFLYSNGSMIDLGPGTGLAINANGEVTGESGPGHAFLYNPASNSVPTDLGTLGGTSSRGTAINANGDVTGSAATILNASHAFLYSNGVMTDLGTLGGTASGGIAINDNGQITGNSLTLQGDSHAFLYSNGVMADIGTFGGTSSLAKAINAHGQVTGYAQTPQNATIHAFLYSNGVTTDLNTVIPAGSGWELREGLAINDRGQIMGSGLINGLSHAFLMSPVSDTPIGTNVSVTPVDPTSGTSPVSITFADVTSGGDTTLTTSSTGAAPPTGFMIGNPAVYYDLSTTATFSGSATVCIDYAGISYGNVNNLKLFHYENGAWVDRTSSVDTGTNTICAAVASFSPFAIFEMSYTFTGFFQPVGNPPILNAVQAGSAIPVKFSLNGYQGLNILAAGYPASAPIACSSATAVDALDPTLTAGSSSLQYDPTSGQYIYVWKSDKSWAGTCRQLTITLRDGSVHTANFAFTK